MTDIESIMVEAAEAEAKRFERAYMQDRAAINRRVVQAQLRALHAAGLGIANVGYYMDEPGYVDGPDLVSVALNHQPQPDANQEN